ncbi:MAG: leucyl/phenylalanyl-tRNA--protein transferase [Bacteroidetes bacterium]|nr:leucyl/phenylalanyl-tRNA--protein transferase [Bacteroidota bacterium]
MTHEEELELLLDPERLLAVYAAGMFPMAPEKDSTEIHWYAPQRRGILPLDQFHVSHNVRRWMRNHPWELRVDTAFLEVMQACADREDTWISPLIIEAYHRLHQVGHSHSVEVWEAGELTGGLYGVSLGSAFFGESMFHRKPDRDKVALQACHELLVRQGFTLWDTQYYTEHLGTMGAIEIPQVEYLVLLDEALHKEATFSL